MQDRAIGMFDTKKCHICGKEFSVSPQYVYKRPHKYFCSYTCMRTFDRSKRKTLDWVDQQKEWSRISYQRKKAKDELRNNDQRHQKLQTSV